MTIQPFDGHDSKWYLIYSNQSDNSIKISEQTYRLVLKVDGKKNLTQIYNEQFPGDEVSFSDFIGLFEDIFVVNKLLKGLEYEEDKKHIFLFKFNFLTEKWIKGICFFTRFLFNRYLAVFMLLFFIVTKFYQYLLTNFQMVKVEELSFRDLLLFYLVSIFVMLFHELGHAGGCLKYGARCKHIGLGVYYIFIAFFADISSAWTLERKKRVMVDLGGVYFQLIIANILFVIYLFFPSPLVIAGFVVNDLTICLNLFPFGRFDGFWVFSDLFGFTNLYGEMRNSLGYFWGKLMKKEPVPSKPKVFTMPPGKRILFAVYSLGFIIVFSLFLIYIIKSLIFSFINFQDIYVITFKKLFNAIKSLDPAGIKNSLGIILYHILLLFIAVRLAGAGIKKLIKKRG